MNLSQKFKYHDYIFNKKQTLKVFLETQMDIKGIGLIEIMKSFLEQINI